MLKIWRKGKFVNNETTYSEPNLYSLFPWTNGSVRLILLAASKESLSEYSFSVNGFNSSDKYLPTE